MKNYRVHFKTDTGVDNSLVMQWCNDEQVAKQRFLEASLVPEDRITQIHVEQNETITFLTLKHFCNGLTEEQLKSPVLVQQEDSGIRITDAYQLEEDYFQNDEGICPVSEFSEEDEGSPLSEHKIIKKGTPYLANIPF
ncbi:hypothetical protein SAMN05192574_101370 [Mucilaginibacter gossypiicola]|uniref:Uncharacterized protein n=1 Tax=Mucilaginibacter gossypiicola TaxID=551995 RepID=A0A1H8A5T1_9SPHI|nr:hypothetical protein [Mucilaginibacter gossypiicola]SEM65951.1 hypothetical protein SAMN05192574_101370 [Mucilaginibacter gossypiicola]